MFSFCLLSMRVLLASAVSWFGCVVVPSLYFSAYLPISIEENDLNTSANAQLS